MSQRLLRNQVRETLTKSLGISNLHAVPILRKAVVNIGIGSFRDQAKIAETIATDLAKITGQKPAARRARKAIAGFKLRQGEVIGLAVTLRGQRLDDFVTRLARITLPRIRDFRGLPRRGFDRAGNYTLGIKEHSVFTEIDHEAITRFYGVAVTLVANAGSPERGEAVLRAYGLPFEATRSARARQ